MPAAPGTIAAYSSGRDNNLLLLRIVAALLVVLTHAYGFVPGARPEPFRATFGLSFGSWAVDVFFALSGFLVSQSWHAKPSAPRFLMARASRIYPALWVCVIFCALVLGPLFTPLPLSAYFAQSGFWKFLVANATILPAGVMTHLPGAFDPHPVDNALWTLPYEVKMYLVLLLLGWLGWVSRSRLLIAVVAASAIGFAWGALRGAHEDPLPETCRFIFCFWSGALFHACRDVVPLRGGIAAALVALLAASVFVLPIGARLLLLTLATPYLALYAGLVPAGFWRRYNRAGDYSYGVYLWGGPVQITLLALGSGPLGVGLNFAMTAGVSVAIAFVSWHVVERPAMHFARAWPLQWPLRLKRAMTPRQP